jgi:hypothetical protein
LWLTPDDNHYIESFKTAFTEFQRKSFYGIFVDRMSREAEKIISL